LSANTPFHVKAENINNYQGNNVYETYYQKSQKNFNLVLYVFDNTFDNPSINSIHNQSYEIDSDSNDNNEYIWLYNEPPLKTGDSITFTFSGSFESGKTYMVCADDPLINANQLGDTDEIINEKAIPSNNYFVFTY